MSASLATVHKHDPYHFVARSSVHHRDSDDAEDTTSIGSIATTPQRVAPVAQKDVIRHHMSHSDDEEYAMDECATTKDSTPRASSTPVALHNDEKADLAQLGANALANVFGFLPLRDIEALRAVGPAVFEEAASMVAPRPLPDTTEVVFVRYEPHKVTTGIPTDPRVIAEFAGPTTSRRASTVPLSVFPWRCLSCGNLSLGPRNCRHCHATLSQAACRVFLGQIRKDLSAEMAQAMLRALVPEANVLHIESHTNAGDGRGKGCAWVYVDSVEDALLVTQLHKRVFVDADAEGFEGYWYVKSEAPEYLEALAGMADELASDSMRSKWLPRQPLVAELPARSMLATYAQAMRH